MNVLCSTKELTVFYLVETLNHYVSYYSFVYMGILNFTSKRFCYFRESFFWSENTSQKLIFKVGRLECVWISYQIFVISYPLVRVCINNKDYKYNIIIRIINKYMKNASNMSTCIDSYTTQSEGSGKLILYLDYFTTEKKLILSFLIVTTISAISLAQTQTSKSI